MGIRLVKCSIEELLRKYVPSTAPHLVRAETGIVLAACIGNLLRTVSLDTVILLDFSGVGMIECAACRAFLRILARRRSGEYGSLGRYIALKNLSCNHRENLEAVLESMGQATVVSSAVGTGCLLGSVPCQSREVWLAIERLGTSTTRRMVEETGIRLKVVCNVAGDLFRDGLVAREWKRRPENGGAVFEYASLLGHGAKLGTLKGTVVRMAEDFDAPLDDFDAPGESDRK